MAKAHEPGKAKLIGNPIDLFPEQTSDESLPIAQDRTLSQCDLLRTNSRVTVALRCQLSDQPRAGLN